MVRAPRCLCYSILLSYLTVAYSSNAYIYVSHAHDLIYCAEPLIFTACLCLYACTCTLVRHTSTMPRVGIFSLIKLGHSSLPLGAAADGEPRQPSKCEDFEGHWPGTFQEPPTSISASSAPAVLQRLLSFPTRPHQCVGNGIRDARHAACAVHCVPYDP